MRRIPRTQRSINNLIPCSHLLRPRISSSPHRTSLTPCSHLAPFSTSPSHGFLLSVKQDKKKHQAFVRRWQKRLLGDSEPIGAHVDPYDATSPVRIAPEEQGEEEEVLTDEFGNEVTKGEGRYVEYYHEASRGSRLRVVGGKEWRMNMEESKLAAEFEKLTLKTYTPLSLKMADEIEDLTGTPYTLRDENLRMAQMYQDVTGKPYTNISFGRTKQAKKLPHLRQYFHQAVVEIYTLKQAGENLDLAAFANRGIYDAPKWISEVKLHISPNGELALAYPDGRTAEQLLSRMQEVPEFDPAEFWAEEPLADEAEEYILGQPEEPIAQSEAETTKTESPSGPKAVVLKGDDGRPFDFMSNRPVPRVKPQEAAPKVEEAPEVVAEPEPEQDLPPSPSSTIEAAAKVSESAVATIRHTVLEAAARSKEETVAAMREAIRDSVTALACESTTTSTLGEVKWRYVSLTDPAIKFALTKRLTQLSGLRISDPHLNSAHTLGDLYGELCAASKPKPKKLFEMIKVEAQKKEIQARAQPERRTAYNKKPGMDELLRLPNVKLRAKRAKAFEKYEEIGLQKVIDYALAERNLDSQRTLRWSSRKGDSLEGTRQVPEFGKPIPTKMVLELKKKREAQKQAI